MSDPLWCYEWVHANHLGVSPDPAIIQHERALDNLLQLQNKYKTTKSIKSKMAVDAESRQIVTSWMLEVCEEQRCEDQVFGLSVQIFDRFVSVVHIKRIQLQLVGCVSLFLASKIRQLDGMTSELLSNYSDFAVTATEIMQWELLVVAKLKWDLCSVTPTDFIDVLLCRVAGSSECPARRHAITFVHLAATEPEFVGAKPSLVAAAAIVSALQGLHPNLVLPATQILSACIKTQRKDLLNCIDSLNNCIRRASASAREETSDDNNNDAKFTPAPTQTKQLTGENGGVAIQSPGVARLDDSLDSQISFRSSSSDEGYETPSDVSDIFIDK